MDIFSLFFTYEGRINRAKFWIAVVSFIAVSIVIVMFVFIPVLGWLVAILGYIAMVVSGAMVGIKRLHDRDKSGWWMLLFMGVPMLLSAGSIGASIYLGLDDDFASSGMMSSLASFAISVWAFVELGCLRGTAGPNRYGLDPLNQIAGT